MISTLWNKCYARIDDDVHALIAPSLDDLAISEGLTTWSHAACGGRNTYVSSRVMECFVANAKLRFSHFGFDRSQRS
jgi:hypothetical protein